MQYSTLWRMHLIDHRFTGRNILQCRGKIQHERQDKRREAKPIQMDKLERS